ncbi:MAG TPA: GDSL-type esterase/lipase family protein [Polyangiaceae bacterium]|nr:GDSL-type esterase/lipase family protein [Polyangiaceae bacterium]HNZ21970.1 GDSL-type esterase/lipase family protein [Polyangiaceae bacterium]HOD23154.1 GDSL-type esterase/lipase family protein [Polyangiaceae bacterium]HOE50347.1 GDSL-type esterase/lipase family protein [Polyangiaceae bacterium]HOH00591.1 GDSL-type esterase/lipase family protein [Polyangiaceae bacterium]
MRTPFQERFGSGGLGFVHVGWKKWGYRHGMAELSVQGQWGIEPPRLLSVEPFDDGVLGLGGVRLVPQKGATASVQARPGTLQGRARWELAVRFRHGRGALRIIPSEGSPWQVHADAQHTHVQDIGWVTTEPDSGFSMEVVEEGVEVFGVVAELEASGGVVFDVLGLNGARVIHALGWNETAWQQRLQRRAPDLLVLAYGTNEAGIRNLSMQGHTQDLVALIDRARIASPNADCLIVGTMDRGGDAMSEKVHVLNEAQKQAAQLRGCAFWSAQVAMGGKASMQRWQKENPPYATSDRVHLTVRGYQKLGNMLATDILQAFDAGTVRMVSESITN